MDEDQTGQVLGGEGDSRVLSPASLRQRRLAALKITAEAKKNETKNNAYPDESMSYNDIQDLSHHDDDEDLRTALAISLEEANDGATRKRRQQKAASPKNKVNPSGVIDLCDSDDDRTPYNKSPDRKKASRITERVQRKTSGGKKTASQDLTQTTSKQTSNKAYPFSIATYNIWFGPPHPLKRMKAISEALTGESSLVGNDFPLFVGLQEVTPELSQMLFPLLESQGYQNVCQDLTSIGYGCAISIQNGCTIIGSGFVPYKTTVMGRGIVWILAKLKDSNREVLFTTTHLESFMRDYPSRGKTYDGVKEREEQIKQLEQFCEECIEKRPSVDMAIITGDLNWDDERKRSAGADKPLLSLLGDGWCDAWKETRPTEEGYTYDSKESQMLKGNLRRRFDRCLFLSRKPKEIDITQTFLIGKEPIPDLQWKKDPHPLARNQQVSFVPVLPSDHFGLVAKIRIATNTKNNE
eukprot:CAMPEP_0195308184 /NCGR_PEP_ID=MMETSP0707-20130614/38092_1 /TAXON_ID=33640 /ORGANISM="Asterionellopsis glacialis, Strain CCMP134" /LENGTH=466 /DNA_ID=CAMNT_0040372443 /DNA_START=341 /DNA_END=1741 /DNA_ORIENTATION=-